MIEPPAIQEVAKSLQERLIYLKSAKVQRRGVYSLAVQAWYPVVVPRAGF